MTAALFGSEKSFPYPEKAPAEMQFSTRIMTYILFVFWNINSTLFFIHCIMIVFMNL